MTQLPPSAQPTPEATTEAEPTPEGPSPSHAAAIALARLLARQAAQEHLATEAARHG